MPIWSGGDRSTFAAIGFVSVLAGTTNTPIATSILAIELFGATVAPYAAVSCVISFLMSGHRSLYSSQVLTISKSGAIAPALGHEIKDITDTAHPVSVRLPASLRHLWHISEEIFQAVIRSGLDAHKINGINDKACQK